MQLANFWQDVRRDLLERNRTYIPRESIERFGVSESQIREGRCTDAFRSMLRFEVERTEGLFAEGDKLLAMLRPQVRRQIALFGMGGRAILGAIRSSGFDTLSSRPTLSRRAKTRLMLHSARASISGSLGLGKS